MIGRQVKCIKCSEIFDGNQNDDLKPCPRCGYQRGIPANKDLILTPIQGVKDNTRDLSKIRSQNTSK